MEPKIFTAVEVAERVRLDRILRSALAFRIRPVRLVAKP